MKDENPNILEVQRLKVYFPVRRNSLLNFFKRKKEYIHAVDGVTFSIRRKQTFAVVGESGSGKTTLGRALTLMVKPTTGTVLLDGQNILEFNASEAKAVVRKKIQMIFQDPFSSLNPRKTVGQAIGVPLRLQNRMGKIEIRERVVELLEITGLHGSIRFKYPHELSGGQRQRIVIARALAAEPEFLIADEPVSKLDLSIKAQIINLFAELQQRMGLTIMFIAHDLRMAKHIGDTIAVMYHGRIMEIASGVELFRDPIHPYTKALLDAIPALNPLQRKTLSREGLKAEDISLLNPPAGCRYFKGCPVAGKDCEDTPVDFKEVGQNHWVACHRC